MSFGLHAPLRMVLMVLSTIGVGVILIWSLGGLGGGLLNVNV